MAKTSRLDRLVVQNSLLRSQIFEGLRPPEITEISSFSRVINLDKGETLFREGEPCEGFFVVQRGAIMHLSRERRGKGADYPCLSSR